MNIQIKNKASLKEFMKFIDLFLKHNFYYISQKYVIYNILSFCQNVNNYDEFENKLNLLVEDLLKKMKI